MEYKEFLNKKRKTIIDSGFDPSELNKNIFDFQEFTDKVKKERQRQIEKWGDVKRSLPECLTILTEEVGEIAKDVHDIHFLNEFPDWIYFKRRGCDLDNADLLPILKVDLEFNLKKELIQVAAVCMQIYDNL